LFWSLAYLAVRWLLQIALLRPFSEAFKELEIVVLRHELAVLSRQVHGPQLKSADRAFLARGVQILDRVTLWVPETRRRPDPQCSNSPKLTRSVLFTDNKRPECGAVVEQSGCNQAKPHGKTSTPKSAQTLASHCNRLPSVADDPDGKERVDGSSPSEGFRKEQQMAFFVARARCECASTRPQLFPSPVPVITVVVSSWLDTGRMWHRAPPLQEGCRRVRSIGGLQRASAARVAARGSPTVAPLLRHRRRRHPRRPRARSRSLRPAPSSR
jgi:hypothetical protein